MFQISPAFFGSAFYFNRVLSNVSSYNLIDEILAAGWTNGKTIIVNVTIPNGITVTGNVIGGNAYDAMWFMNPGGYTFGPGSQFQLTIASGGTLRGCGGAGGAGTGVGSTTGPAGNGGPGSNAFKCNIPGTKMRLIGNLWAGGGGGGGGGGYFPGTTIGGGGGGGGAGTSYTDVPPGGAGYAGSGYTPGYNGNPGGSIGGTGGKDGQYLNYGKGGDGGGYGQAGAAGLSTYPTNPGVPGSGGPAGYAIYGKSYVTVDATGQTGTVAGTYTG